MLVLLPSQLYWPLRYRLGGISGPGSRGRLAEFKARVLNDFVSRNHVRSVIELGCGNGDQLSLADYPRYMGVDISRSALNQCRKRFNGDSTKSFRLLKSHKISVYDLAISLDVIFHLAEERSFRQHMELLFSSATRFVIIYSSNYEAPKSSYQVRHRAFSRWVETNRPDWQLLSVIPNDYPRDTDWSSETSLSDFYVYVRRTPVTPVPS